jgi:hypothetical protein
MALPLAADPVERCELLLAAGDARGRAGDTTASKAAFREAADLAGRHDLAEHLARAALGYGGRIIWEVSRDDEHLVPLLERALAALGDGDSPLRVRLMARLAGGPLRDARFPPERKASLSEAALAMARRLGDRATLAYAIQGYILGHHAPSHTPRQLELATELIALAAEAGDKERMVEGHEERLNALIELGRVDEAKRELDAMDRLAAELRQPSQEWLAAVYRAQLALLQDPPEQAERAIAAARAIGGDALSWNAEVTYRLQLYVLRHQQGALDGIEELVRRSLAEYPTYAIWRCVHVHMAAALGYADEARLALTALGPIPVDEEWLVGVSLLAEAVARIGALEHAPALYDALAPYADRMAVSYPELSIGAVARYLRMLAAAMGHAGDAERHAAQASELHRRVGAHPWFDTSVTEVS